ncbi:MAG: DNA polymerase III subunit gamma/tau [Bacilli bacterium]|nr:DNA polymerase III subunit gamma/tau [Bacilli bacterium]
MYQALYRKYRPQKFEDVVGQKVIVKTLSNAILNNKITHAYLFAGPRGTGKTSIAKIFAKTINCEHLSGLTPCEQCISCMQISNKQTTDIIEIDAASNNGVEEIREIKNKVNLVPTNGKYKVYIIDEVHMLTTAAFNAMLKTLEEPPQNVIFILATTEPHKIPLTILSRCQRYDFKRLSNKEIVERLEYIVKQENIQVENGVLAMIAEISNGGMRDSVGLLDQLITYCDDIITVDAIHEINGTISNEQMFGLIRNIIQRNFNNVYNLVNRYDNEGKNIYKIFENVVVFLKNVLIYVNCPNFFENEILIEQYEQIIKLSNEKEINLYIEFFLQALKNLKMENNKKLLIELCLINIYDKLKKNKKDNIESDKERNNEITTVEKKVKNDLSDKIKELKKIRVNNALALFNKKQMMELKNELYHIQEMINNSDYSSIISLIMDGELRARGDNYLIFVYTNESMEKFFNMELLKIEELFKKVFNVNYKVIGVNTNEWEIIKKKFNDSLKNNQKIFIYQEETINVEDVFNISNNSEVFVKNDIDNMFAEIVEYN